MPIKRILLSLYTDQRGKTPFLEWITSLNDQKIIYRVRERLNRIRLGNLGDYRSVGSGVFEFRLHFGSGYRVYFAKKKKNVLLLLCAGDKKTQSKDIKKAIEYWMHYQEEVISYA